MKPPLMEYFKIVWWVWIDDDKSDDEEDDDDRDTLTYGFLT